MVDRLTRLQSDAVVEQRLIGRTDRQIEKILGLSSGFLSRPWLVDHTEDELKARAEESREEWRERERRFQKALSVPQRPEGWRPQEDCVKSRPDQKPLRSVPKGSGR